MGVAAGKNQAGRRGSPVVAIAVLALAISFLLLCLANAFARIGASGCPRPERWSAYFACFGSPAGFHQALAVLFAFLALVAAIVPFGAFVAAQVSTADWARGWKIAGWLRPRDGFAEVDPGPLVSLVETLRGLYAKDRLTPDQLELFLLEALALARGHDEATRKSFADVASGKAEQAADRIVAAHGSSVDHLLQAARLYAPYSAEKAQRTYRKLLEIHKEPCAAGFELGVLELQLGERARDADDADVANEALKSARALIERHSTGKRASLAQELLACATLAEARVALAHGAFESGREGARRARDIYAALAEESPSEPRYGERLAASETLLGELALANGLPQQANGHYAAALTVSAQLARQKPGGAEARSIALNAHEALAEIARLSGDLRAAGEHSAAAGRVAAKLPQPQLLPRERHMARLQRQLRAAQFAVDAGDLTTAEKHYSDALALLDAVAAEEPHNISWRDQRATVLRHLGDVTALAGGLPGAGRHYRAALEVVDALAGDSPLHFSWRWQRFLLHVQLARIAEAQGENELSARHVKLADAAIEAMAKQWNLHPVIARTFSDFRIAQPTPQVRVDLF